jgi:hypothetical protein
VPLGEQVELPDGSAAAQLGDSEIEIGELTVADDEVFFNGRPIADPGAEALAAACAALQRGAAHD